MRDRTAKNNEEAKSPEIIGESNHETIMATTPLTYGNWLDFAIHVTQLDPLATIVIPIMPPTHECVVDTGISK